MPYFVLLYESVVDDYVVRRAPFRAEHLRLLTELQARGQVVMGGAVGQPPQGALIVFQCDSPDVVEAFVAVDPYVQNGLIRTWRIQPWNVVIGAGA
jgi:uncharacterized protein YciI